MAKVVVVGAGPAGMMAAIKAAEKNNVILIESNERVGKKLFITGKGRCNVTNSKDISEFFEYIPGNPHFLYSALYTYNNEMVIDFFENLGVALKNERGGRMFPLSDKSSDIISAFKKKISQSNIKLMLNSKVIDIKCQNNIIDKLILNDGKQITADHFIFCTGGKSYPKTGSDGQLHLLLEKLGHTIVPLKPSLVPIELNSDYLELIQGLTLKNILAKILKIDGIKEKNIYEKQGELKFMNYGVSGPIILSASRYIKGNDNFLLSLDLKPALDLKSLDLRLQKDFSENLNAKFKDSLNKLFPQKLIPVILQMSKIDLDKQVNSITKEERKSLAELIKNIKFEIKGLRDISEAIVTAGGISTKEIDPSTMRSKIIKNVSFAGELIDVDAFTGGYNVQIALSTGYLAGENI